MTRPTKIITYNTWHTFTTGGNKDKACQFVKSQSPDIIALQELYNINDKDLEVLAHSWGHPFSLLLKTSGYSVGISSYYPIKVIEKIFTGMHHGALHVTIQDRHYIVVHLSPFEWEKRVSEAEIIMNKVSPLMNQGEKVVILGDFNALSEEDKAFYDMNPYLLESTRDSDANHIHIKNLKNNQLCYNTLNVFFKGGMKNTLPRLNDKQSLNTCPSGINQKDAIEPLNAARVDYILAYGYKEIVHSAIIREGVVNEISDHLPVFADINF